MKLVSDIFERLPQVWVLVGLLFFATGLYLGFDYSLVFVYLGIGTICLAYGLVLFVLLLGERPRKSKANTLSRDFISIGNSVIMPAQQADEDPSSRE